MAKAGVLFTKDTVSSKVQSIYSDLLKNKEKTLKVVIKLENCYQCRHINHSGSHTIRGARLICNHSDVYEERVTKEDFIKEYPEYAQSNFTYSKYHWIHRVLDKGGKDDTAEIPVWCPLRHGKKY